MLNDVHQHDWQHLLLLTFYKILWQIHLDYFLLRIHAMQGVGEEDFKRLGGDVFDFCHSDQSFHSLWWSNALMIQKSNDPMIQKSNDPIIHWFRPHSRLLERCSWLGIHSSNAVNYYQLSSAIISYTRRFFFTLFSFFFLVVRSY